ncbi:MAG: hypothetical protein Q9162_004034 [Coniocarpon cinnabarinum]
MTEMTIPGIEEFRLNRQAYSYLTPYGGSYYAQATRLTPDHYQSLIDHGWRRSGNVCYLPDPVRSCCPHYTIRLSVQKFSPRKDHRQALSRWNRQILGPNYTHEAAKRSPKTREQKKKQMEGLFDLLSAVHEPEVDHLVEGTENVEGLSKYQVTLETDEFTEEKYRLFEKYQREVHRDESSRSGFKRFLCSSPVTRETRTIAVPTGRQASGQINGGTTSLSDQSSHHFQQKLGSFHQLHRLNGELIAMSVLDLLPHAVSAVYFIYDPEYSRFSLGKVSALREATLALEGGYDYYYMGYYIHSCAKMRYKNEYKPQEFLDWKSREWVKLDSDALRAFDEDEHVRMSQDDQGAPLKYPSIREGADALASLWTLRMPGITPYKDLIQKINLEGTLASVKMPAEGFFKEAKSVVVPVSLLKGWQSANATSDDSGDQAEDLDRMQDDESGEDSKPLRTTVAEFCAAVGVNVAKEMVLDFGGGIVDS